jgi:uncharacterized protein YqeY
VSLLQKLDDGLKVSFKASDSLRVYVLRMSEASLKNRQIDKGRGSSEEEI